MTASKYPLKDKSTLQSVAKAMTAPGHGVLAADESTSNRNKRFSSGGRTLPKKKVGLRPLRSTRFSSRVCFFAMPFLPELNFFFLYLQHHLWTRHKLRVRRGDTTKQPMALLDKIESEIRTADLIIADITSNNPNVCFELGIAWAFDKPIIFLTQSDPKLVPTNLRYFEFIQYNFNCVQEFLLRLDRAVQIALGGLK